MFPIDSITTSLAVQKLLQRLRFVNKTILIHLKILKFDCTNILFCYSVNDIQKYKAYDYLNEIEDESMLNSKIELILSGSLYLHVFLNDIHF